jgi:sec-independent protein translocase protein TatA
MMPNIGPLELAIVLVVALIVFGPKRLPELGRSMGRGMREFRTSVKGEGDGDAAQGKADATPPAIESPASTSSAAEAQPAAQRRD